MDEQFKRELIGAGTEIGGGIGTDLATSPLLMMGPKVGLLMVLLTLFKVAILTIKFKSILTQTKILTGEKLRYQDYLVLYHLWIYRQKQNMQNI